MKKQAAELINGIPVNWYNKYAAPYGHSIFRYDECYIKLSKGGYLRVSKHYKNKDKFSHYCCTELNGTYSSGEWFHKTWESLISKIKEQYDIKCESIEKSAT
jgi:hypothetical protein